MNEMEMKKIWTLTNLQKRVLVSLIYFPLLLLSAFNSQWLSWAIAIITLACWHEYLLFRSKPTTQRDWAIHFSKVLFGSLPPVFMAMSSSFGLAVGLLGLALQIYVIRSLIGGMSFAKIMDSLGFTLFGVLYITGLFSSILLLRANSAGGESVWFLFFVVGAADTGAYFAGRSFGRTPFFQVISPKKTVEGFYGGLAAAIAVAVAFHFVMKSLDFVVPSVIGCVFVGAVVAMASVFGDLFESMLKRHYNLKDSGNLLPGHGGVLDRFDGVMFGALPLLCYVLFRNGFH